MIRDQTIASPPSVWVLADDRTGDVAQCLGVAEALGLPFAVKDLRYSWAAILPNHVRGARLAGLTDPSRAALAPPWPRVVISAGRRTAPASRWIKAQSGAFTVQIMDPGWWGRGDFDLVAIPSHDCGGQDDPANVLRVLGAPHRVTPERLAAEAERFRAQVADLPRPLVLVLVGGSTRRRRFGAAAASQLGHEVGRLAGTAGGALLVSTSRRTGRKAAATLLAALPEPRLVYGWGSAGPNPFFGWLGLADAVVVTGDSVSMVSEACATSAPVYVWAPPGMVIDKHARFHQELFALGMARPMNGALAPWSHPPLNSAAAVAAEIRRRLGPTWCMMAS